MDALFVAFVLTTLGTAASMIVASAGDASYRPGLVRRSRATALVMAALLMFTLTGAGFVADGDPPSDDTGIAIVFFLVGIASCVAARAVARGRLWTALSEPSPQVPDVPFAGPRRPERVGVRAAERESLWSTDRYFHRPLRVVAGNALLIAGALGLTVIAVSRGNDVGAAMCGVAVLVLALTGGFRNPIGSVPASVAVVLAYVGGLAGWLAGAVPFLCLATLILVLEVHWRRDDE